MPKSHSIKAPSRASLESFIAKVLEPVTDAELSDFEYNRMAREARRAPWNAIERKARYYDALRNAALCCDASLCDDGLETFEYADRLPGWEEMTELHRVAYAEQLVTPAHQAQDVDWKKKQIKMLGYVRGLVTPAQLAASIADDEDFFARHPIRRERAAQ